MSRERDNDPTSRERTPSVARVVYALLRSPGSQTADHLAEATGLDSGGIETAGRMARRVVTRDGPAGSDLRVSKIGGALTASLVGLGLGDVERLFGPEPPPASYLGHNRASAALVRLLVEAGGAPLSLDTMSRALYPTARGTKSGRSKVKSCVAVVTAARAERGCTETVLASHVDGLPAYLWGPSPAATHQPGAPADAPSDTDDDEPRRYNDRPVRITLPSVDGAYVYTGAGLYLDGVRRSRDSGLPSPGPGALR